MNTEREQKTPVYSEPHQCGDLFGCGETSGTGVIREDLAEAAFSRKAADRLLRKDEVNQQTLDGYLTVRGRSRRSLLRASGFMGALAAIGPWFTKLAGAREGIGGSGNVALDQKDSNSGEGKVHTVESNKDTVHLGVFDTTLATILTIDSGDIVSYTNTWSHFLNQLEPGVPVEKLAELRTSNPGRGPHSIIGPIAVKGAEPGDVVEIRYLRLRPAPWGAVFNNPASLGTGLLAQDFPQGQIKYVDLDLANMRGKFAPNISIPLQPF